MLRLRGAAVACVSAVLVAACHTTADYRTGFTQVGLASWYGAYFHHRRTANGEVFDMYGRTAAHRTLPLNSYVRVTMLATGRSVVVRINDRGPFIRGRSIDLSTGAAEAVGMTGAGVAQVRMEVIK
jgi:rare lipoprotein A